jgi:hypothetical protein
MILVMKTLEKEICCLTSNGNTRQQQYMKEYPGLTFLDTSLLKKNQSYRP